MEGIVDLTGRRFGRLLVMARAPNDEGYSRWRCLCDCGQESIVVGSNLHRGKSHSCGCLHNEQMTTHGLSRTPEYTALRVARYRCTKSSHQQYKNYGGRGIEYRLPSDPGEATAMLIKSIGPRPEGLTLDRINNDGHYEPGNLRWATRAEQGRNRRKPRPQDRVRTVT